MVKQFVPPRTADGDRRTSEVLKILQPVPALREEAEGEIDGAIAVLIWEAMELGFNRAATSAEVSHAADRVTRLLGELRPLLDSFGGLGEFWKADVRLPTSQDVDRWIEQLKRIQTRQFVPKSDASLVKLAAARAALLARLSRYKMTKKEIARLGAALLGDQEAAGAVYSYLKGKKPLSV